MKLERLTPEQWTWLASTAHRAVFQELRDAGVDRVHHVLLAVEGAEPIGYMTIQERDAHTAHIQFGGAFPPVRGSLKAVRAWSLALGRLKESYRRVTMRVENTNRPMLKLALAMHFKVVGIHVQADKILLEHALNFYDKEC